MGLDISFAIADADGLPRLFRRFGDALVLSATLVRNLMGMNTCDPRLTLVPGGGPLTVEGKIVGAIGVGGGSREQDLEIADFILSKFKEISIQK